MRFDESADSHGELVEVVSRSQDEDDGNHMAVCEESHEEGHQPLQKSILHQHTFSYEIYSFFYQ